VEAGIPLPLGISPIFNAILGARVEMVEYFIEKLKHHELDPDSRDMYGRTPQEFSKLEYDDELAETQCGGGKGTLERNLEINTILSNLEYHRPIPVIPILLSPLLSNDSQSSIKTHTTDTSSAENLPATPVSADRAAKSVKIHGKMNRSKSEKASKRDITKKRDGK